MSKQQVITVLLFVFLGFQVAHADPAEIYCTIRPSGSSLNCQWVGQDRKSMTADDISKFINQGQIAAYITLKSRKGMERVFMVDPNAGQYKHLNDVKKSSSISEINKAESDLFDEIEKKVIKISDELDAQASAAELVFYDSSIALDKMKRENHAQAIELAGYRKNKEKICTATPAFEQMSRANASLQQTLSNIVTAFQTKETCMDKANFKVYKDKDGTVDLRQLNDIPDKYRTFCSVKR